MADYQDWRSNTQPRQRHDEGAAERRLPSCSDPRDADPPAQSAGPKSGKEMLGGLR
jgi:hypothetical protein